MRRTDRLFAITRLLRRDAPVRAQAIADRLGVSVRTIYRDMDTLAASGVPVRGTRGSGYCMPEAITLPPLTLTPDELAALNLGIAIVAETTDPELHAAARSLADKVDAALPAEPVAEDEAWKFAAYPFANAARGLSHMATLRSAVAGRQKLELGYRRPDGGLAGSIVRPLHLEFLGRGWALTVWCECDRAFRIFRVDLIETARPLPELFVDEPGKRLGDLRAATTP